LEDFIDGPHAVRSKKPDKRFVVGISDDGNVPPVEFQRIHRRANVARQCVSNAPITGIGGASLPLLRRHISFSSARPEENEGVHLGNESTERHEKRQKRFYNDPCHGCGT
jgi:hypothetical protein